MVAAEALAKDFGAKQVVVRRISFIPALGLGVAAELPVEGAQPAADLGARVRRLELGLAHLGGAHRFLAGSGPAASMIARASAGGWPGGNTWLSIIAMSVPLFSSTGVSA